MKRVDRSGKSARRLAGIAARGLFCFGLVVMIFVGCVDAPLLPEPLGPDAMRAELKATGFPASASPGTVLRGTITALNAGRAIWPADGEIGPQYKVNLGYRWLDPSGAVVVPYGSRRAALPSRVRPGGRARVEVAVEAPRVAGEYLLEFDLVQENVSWFAEAGSETCRIPIRLLPG